MVEFVEKLDKVSLHICTHVSVLLCHYKQTCAVHGGIGAKTKNKTICALMQYLVIKLIIRQYFITKHTEQASFTTHHPFGMLVPSTYFTIDSYS